MEDVLFLLQGTRAILMQTLAEQWPIVKLSVSGKAIAVLSENLPNHKTQYRVFSINYVLLIICTARVAQRKP